MLLNHSIAVEEDGRERFVVTVWRDQFPGGTDMWIVHIAEGEDDHPTVNWQGPLYINYDVLDGQLESRYPFQQYPRLVRLLSEAIHRCVMMFGEPSPER